MAVYRQAVLRHEVTGVRRLVRVEAGGVDLLSDAIARAFQEIADEVGITSDDVARDYREKPTLHGDIEPVVGKDGPAMSWVNREMPAHEEICGVKIYRLPDMDLD